MKRAVIYARYSSERQTEQSIEGQLRVCNDFAGNNDYTIVGTYIDRATTGTNDHRDEFQKMIKDSAKRNFDVVIVYKLDRFARNRYDSIVNKSILKKNGVKVISATEPISDKPEGIILESLLDGMAEYYSVELSQKVKRGMNESRLKNLFTGGKCLFGYRIIERKYVIYEEEAGIVRRIFRDFINGVKIKDIVYSLNQAGICIEKNKKVTPSRISLMLRNAKYIGKCIIAGKEYPEMVPAIIDEQTFYKAQEILSRGKFKNARSKADAPYLLSGKIYCGRCNSLITGSAGTGKSKKVHYYYKCAVKSKHTHLCDSHTYRKDDFENFVLYSVLNKLSVPSIFNEIVDKTVALYNEEIKENLDLKMLKKRLADINKQLDNYAIAIGQGIFNEKVQEIMTSLIEDKKNVETEIAIQEHLKEKPITHDIVKGHLEKIFKYDTADSTSKKLIFDTFISKIIVYDDDNILIICNSLDQEFITKNEHHKVFAFVDFGGVEGT